MTEIILIRHGETEFNREGRMQGRRDSALTEKGRAEAAALGRRLGGLPPADAWIVSPLGRTRETSRIMRENMSSTDLPEERHAPEIQEISCGEFEGRLKSELDPEYLGRIQGLADVPYPGGESLLDVMERARQFLKDPVFNRAGRIVLVTHGNFGRAFGAAATGQGPDFALRCVLENTGVCRFVSRTPSNGGEAVSVEQEGYYLLRSWNDVSHLEQSSS